MGAGSGSRDLPAHFDRLVSRALASNAGNGDQIARVPTKPGEETGEVPGKVDTGTFSNSGWVPCRVCSSATPTVSRGPRIEPRFSRWVFETSKPLRHRHRHQSAHSLEHAPTTDQSGALWLGFSPRGGGRLPSPFLVSFSFFLHVPATTTRSLGTTPFYEHDLNLSLSTTR